MLIPADVWTATLERLRSCGGGRRECVVYWVGSGAEVGTIARAVHPVHTATPFHYRVDDAWLTRFWVDLATAAEQVRVQVHTHGGRAGHSPTDDKGALVYQEGFLSLVLPGFAMRDDCEEQAFLAELDSTGSWRRVPVRERLAWT